MRGVALVLLLALAACDHPVPQCRNGADCASGVCHLDACGDGELPSGAGESLGLEPDETPWRSAPLEPLACVPNRDGVVAADEMRHALGVPVSYLGSAAGVSQPVDVAGAADAGGGRVWDWRTAHAGDQVARVAAAELEGRWYAGSFPAAHFVVPFDLAGALEAVYSSDGEALWLHGIASAKADASEGRTLLVYDRPIALFRFPMRAGDSWTSTGAVRDSLLRGLPYAGRDTYEVRVDAEGRLDLPSYSFARVLRVRTRVSTAPSVGRAFTRRQVSFVTECFGEVARAASLDDEPAEDFTTASELRRLGQ